MAKTTAQMALVRMKRIYVTGKRVAESGACGLTYVVLPADLGQCNGRALRDDEADGVVDDLDDGVGLGSELRREDLGTGNISRHSRTGRRAETYGTIQDMGPRSAE